MNSLRMANDGHRLKIGPLLVVASLALTVLFAPAAAEAAQETEIAETPSGPPSNRCKREQTRPGAEPTGERLSLQKPKITDDAEAVVLEFSRSRDEQATDWEIPLTVPLVGAGSSQVQVRPFGFENVRESMVVEAFVLESEDGIYVRFCWDPSQPRQTPAGEYRGTVRITDPAFQSIETPIVVRLQDRELALPLLAVATSAASGTLWQWGSLARSKVNPQRRKWTYFKLTAGQLEFGAAVLAGVGVAGWSVFLGDYTDNPSWTANMATYKGIVTASFAASTGAYGAAAVVTRLMVRGDESSDKPADKELTISEAGMLLSQS